MPDGSTVSLPPLQGCLFCHSEGTMVLKEGHKFLGFGSELPVLKCERCGAVALLDINNPGQDDGWRIRYLRFRRSPDYYYVAHYLGKAGWLRAVDALAISTDGYVQRQRVRQAQDGNLAWLQPRRLYPPPPLMDINEQVYVALRGVTYEEAPFLPLGFLARWGQGAIQDSGKFYVTDQKLHLLGQRRDWLHPLEAIETVRYGARNWVVQVTTPDGLYQFRGGNIPDQMDAQLIAAVIEALKYADN